MITKQSLIKSGISLADFRDLAENTIPTILDDETMTLSAECCGQSIRIESYSLILLIGFMEVNGFVFKRMVQGRFSPYWHYLKDGKFNASICFADGHFRTTIRNELIEVYPHQYLFNL